MSEDFRMGSTMTALVSEAVDGAAGTIATGDKSSLGYIGSGVKFGILVSLEMLGYSCFTEVV